MVRRITTDVDLADQDARIVVTARHAVVRAGGSTCVAHPKWMDDAELAALAHSLLTALNVNGADPDD